MKLSFANLARLCFFAVEKEWKRKVRKGQLHAVFGIYSHKIRPDAALPDAALLGGELS